jgi:hypothetical protein
MDWLGEQLGFKTKEDWYKITFFAIRNYGGNGLLELYNGSPSEVVLSVYRDYPWLSWKFHQVPNKFWNIKDNRISYLNWLAKKINLKDWYKLKGEDIRGNHGDGLLRQYGSVASLIIDHFPEYQLLPWKFSKFVQLGN